MNQKLLRPLICLLALSCLLMGCNKEDGKEKEEGTQIGAVFTITPETGPVNTQFEFNAEGSFYMSSYTTGVTYHECTYRWDFNYQGEDDIFYDIESDDAITTYVYQSPGTYTVKFELAYSPSGYFIEPYPYERISKTLVVTEAPSSNPTAYLEVVNPNGYPNIFMFTFVGGGDDLEDPQEALQVRWDWENDGIFDTQFSNEFIVNHFYQNPGTYIAKIQVIDTDENIGEMTDTVFVQGPGGEPCPGFESVEYGPDSYPTVLIGDQCWFAKNLNIGSMILNTALPSQNEPIEIIEKYCYSNDVDSCLKYGGLYNWNELMQYVQVEGSQGICPVDWHIPTDEEWMELEGEIDSQYGYPDDHWDQYGPFRGSDLGTNIRSQSFWYDLGVGYDKFGFNGQPGGQRKTNSTFEDVGLRGFYWTSTGLGLGANARYLNGGNQVSRELDQKDYGYSVRCIKN